MRNYNKEKILLEGSMKEKIKLYFIHIAETNISGENLLTQDEINAIYFNIEAPQDVRYYANLRRYNKTFLVLTPRLQALKNNLLKKIAEMLLLVSKLELIVAQENSFNTITTLILKNLNEEQKEERMNKFDIIRKKLKQDKTELLREERNIQSTMESINESIRHTKKVIEQMKYLLNKKLRLPPYKDYINNEEKDTKENIEKAKKLIEKHLKGRDIEPPTSPEHTNGAYYIYNWEEIEIEIDLKDLDLYMKLANE